jgi:hypothetical protein
MNRSQNNVLMLFIGIGILLVSGNSFINLSTSAIESNIQALWAVFAIALTLTGLLVAPVLVIMSFGGLVKQVLQPARKQKQKNA